MRVVFDTCVWVSAVKSRRGASFALLSEIPHQRFKYGISVPLFVEYKSKLIEMINQNKTPLNRNQAEAILSALAYYGTAVPIYYLIRPNLRDENDNMVFECAVNFGAAAIITHNIKDYTHPELNDYGIEIVTPGKFIQNIRRSYL